MAAAKGRTNLFAIGVTAAVVIVLIALVGIVVWMNNKATDPGEKPTSSRITSSGGITYGASKTNTITIYVDFLCPICNQFEKSEGDTIKKLVDQGKAKLVIQPVAILDTWTTPAGYSSRAASAMYSVAIRDYANSYAFMQAMYEKQPAERSSGLTNQQIIDIAKQSGVSMTKALQSELNSNRYQKYAQNAPLPKGAKGTPTLMINGKLVPVTMNPNADILANLK